MSRNIPEYDPPSEAEQEGIPDLQEDSPQGRWSVDPMRAALPADEPVAVDDYGTTAEEQRAGEPLDLRLAREVPEPEAVFDQDERGQQEDVTESDEDEEELTEDGGLGVGADLDTRYQPDEGMESGRTPQPDEPSGAVWDEPRPAGRIVAPDEGFGEDTEPDEVATEVGPDSGGYSAEEAAMRVERE